MNQIAIDLKLTLLNQCNSHRSLPHHINRVTVVPEFRRLAEVDGAVVDWLRKVCRWRKVRR